MNSPATPTGPADRDLLRAFADRADGAAFAELVRRHGPVVLGVCRRVLNDTPDADDAFQATFLVLAKRAAAVGRPDRVSNWLYGVALRCARRARAAAAARRAKERPMPDFPAPPAAGSDWADARPVLDEEIGRLPDRLRAALVACELRGLDRAAAAADLGIPEGTLSSRLARAKELLRRRLVRRGVALSALGLGIVLAEATARAAVPPGLAADVTTAAARFAAGPGVVPGPAVLIARKELAVMLWKNVVVTGLALAAGLGVVGGGVWVGVPAVVRAAEGAKGDKDAIQGEWKIVSAKKAGKGPAEEDVIGRTLTITADEVKFHFDAGYTLDPSKDPKRIDLTPSEGAGNEKGKVFQGIYKLAGDKLTIHLAHPGEDRPTDFENKDDGTNNLLLELERVKK